MEIKKSDNMYVLCGGTFFTLLLQSRKPTIKRRQRIEGEKDTFHERDILLDLLKIVYPNYPEIEGSTFKTVTSDFKHCKIDVPNDWKFDDQNVIDEFLKEQEKNYEDVLKKMSSFILKYIDTDSSRKNHILLVKRLIELISYDRNIGEYKFTVNKHGTKKSANELIVIDEIELSSFLLSVWTYIVEMCGRNNKIGDATIAKWFPDKKQPKAQAKYMGLDGSTIMQNISIQFKYDETYEECNNNRTQVDSSIVVNTNVNDGIDSLLIKHFNYVKVEGRYHNYINQEHKITEIRNTLSVSDKTESKTLENIVFENNIVNNVSIYGRGGCGKTFQLIHLVEYILDPINEKTNIEPFYIPLNIFANANCSKDNLIIEYLTNTLIRFNENISVSEIKDFLNCENRYSKKIPLVLLDGLNEITNSDIRQKVISDIIFIRKNYKNVKLVLTSRQNHATTFTPYGDAGKFVRASVDELTQTQIEQYLKAVNSTLKISSLTYQQRELLKTPQGLVMYTEMYSGNQNIDIHNLGCLLEQYINSIVQLDNNDKKDILDIASQMVKQGLYRLSVARVRNTWKNLNYNSVAAIFTESDNRYEFSHQNFRDYFAARWLCNKIQELALDFSDKILKYTFINDNLFNEEILQLVADIISLSDIQEALDSFKNNNVDFPFAISKLIRIASLKNSENDISNLDLSGFNLSEVCLNGYKLYSDNSHIELGNSIISNDTFMNSGLQSASSTICKYDLDDKQYLTIFSSTNIMVYNVTDNIWKCYRDMPNMIWTHSYCKVYINNHLYIVYGGRRFRIRCFDPANGLSYQVLTFPNNNESNNILSICSIVNLDNNDLIFFASNGIIYHLSCDALPKNNNGILPTPIFIIPYFVEATAIYKCRLTISNEHIYASAKNKVYRCSIYDLKKSLKNNCFNNLFKEYKVFNADMLIYDICFTDSLLYVNLGKIISCINTFDDYEFESIGICASNDDFKGFRKFSIEEDGNVICGVNSTSFNECENLYKIYIENNELVITPIQGNQELIVHSSAYYKINNSERIASVSDDRSIQIIAPNDEDIEPVRYKGAYYGVHDIALISDTEIFAAQYDGSVSYWKKQHNEWKCNNVFPIHTGWVWAIKYYKPYIISCSYDGTIKMINIETHEIKQLLSIISCDYDGKFLDFDIMLDKSRNPVKIVAITHNYVYYMDISNCKQFIKPINPGFTARAVKFYEKDSIMIAINGDKISKMIQWNMRNDFLELFVAEQECGFIRRFDVYNIHECQLLIIAGNTREIKNNAFNEYYAFYLKTNKCWQRIQINNSIGSTDNIGILSPIYFVDFYPLTGTSVNDFAVIDTHIDENLLELILISVTKNNVFIYLLKFDEKNKIVDFSQVASIAIDAQPMCIKVLNDTIFLGFLNGFIREFRLIRKNLNGCYQSFQLEGDTLTSNISDGSEIILGISNMKTHPNLITDGKVNLRSVKYNLNTNIDKFKRDFNGYFRFTR